MYVKSFFKYQNSYLDEKELKKLLKPLTNMDLRRISKFNLLSIYGSLNTIQSIDFSKNCSIYIATHSGCIDETYKVINELKENNPVMPFDFLNINTNNTGFYISKALDLNSLSYTISSNHLSFERAIELAFIDYKNKINIDFLIGFVESSTNNIPNQVIQKDDISNWIYFDSNKLKSFMNIKSISFFDNIDELNSYLDSLKTRSFVINIANKDNLKSLKTIDLSSITHGDIFYILENNLVNISYISISGNNAYLFEF